METIDRTIGPGNEAWSREPSVDAGLRQSWLQDGLVVMPGLVPADQVDKHVTLVAGVRGDVPNGTDEHGLGDRIGQLHQRVPDLIDTVANDRLLGFLKWALGDSPLLFASLNFDRGTQQESHVDLIYFCTEPLYSMVGVWVALEDIDMDAGPLFYHMGSHHWPFEYPGEVGASQPPVEGDELGSRATAWLNRLSNRISETGSQSKPMAIKKGDAVIWHAKLAHGGMPRIRPELSRKSVVYHFIGENSRLYSFQDFFSYSKEALLTRQGVQVPMATRGLVKYQVHPYFVTYHDGQELVHSLG